MEGPLPDGSRVLAMSLGVDAPVSQALPVQGSAWGGGDGGGGADGGFFSPGREVVAAVLLLATMGALYLGFIGARSLWVPDEGRYSEIPREMRESGDFVTPREDGERFLEKPPLWYWVTAASQALLGESEWVNRLPVALASLGTIALVAALGWRMRSARTGLLAAMILGVSPLPYIVSQIVLLDAGFTFLLSLALALALLAEAGMAASLAPEACALALALATLVKGPLAVVLFVPIVVVSRLLGGKTPVVWSRRLTWAVAIYSAVTLPWFVMVSLTNPGFFQVYIVLEHVDRYLADCSRHPAPFHYFQAVVLAGFFPWSFTLPLLPLGIRRPLERADLGRRGPIITRGQESSARRAAVSPAMECIPVARPSDRMERGSPTDRSIPSGEVRSDAPLLESAWSVATPSVLWLGLPLVAVLTAKLGGLALLYRASVLAWCALLCLWSRTMGDRGLLIRFSGCWAMVPLVFMAPSVSKLPTYVLAAWPGLTLLAAVLWDRLIDESTAMERRALLVLLSLAACVVVAGAATLLAASPSRIGPEIASIRSGLASALLCVALGLASAGWLAVRGLLSQCVLTVFALGVFSCVLIQGVGLRFQPRKDNLVLCEAIRAVRKGSEPIVVFGPIQSVDAIPYYLKERILLAGSSRGELELAHSWSEPGQPSVFIALKDMMNRLDPRGPFTLFIARGDDEARLSRHAGFAPVEIARTGPLVLFANRPPVGRRR